jgi:hypothetical protein
VALAEHASVASFSRLALELLALGAPPDLVDDAHAAARDEVRHARLTFGLASAGVGVGPGPLPLADLTLAADLVSLAVATAREGCVAETISALQVAEASPADDAERAVLAVLARDEARHAAFAWRVLRWAIDAGGEPVRAAVAEVFARPPSFGEDGPLTSRAVAERGWREVIRPTADALLAVPTPDSAVPTA